MQNKAREARTDIKCRGQGVQPVPLGVLLPVVAPGGTRRGTGPGSFPAPRPWRCPGPAPPTPPALRRPHSPPAPPGRVPPPWPPSRDRLHVSDPNCPEPWWCTNNKAVDGPGGPRSAIDHAGSARDGERWNICNGAAQVWPARCEQPVLASTGSTAVFEQTTGGLRLCEDLIHSRSKADIGNGLKLAEELAGDANVTSDNNAQAVYLCALAQYKLSRYVEARRQLTELLKVR